MALPLGNVSVGNSVYLKVNGARKEFLIVHQGLPSSMYDSSCNGTWLMMKDIYEKREWSSSSYTKIYANSSIHNYLNNDFFNLIDAQIRSSIKTVKIPYYSETSYNTETNPVKTGASGLQTKVFLPSCYEIGIVKNSSPNYAEHYIVQDGNALSYFSGAADSNRIAYLNGSATVWWTRSPYYYDDPSSVMTVTVRGKLDAEKCYESYGIRPMMVLPADMNVDPDTFDVTASPSSSIAPKGKHNTLIGGTAYEITGGKVLVGGTAYGTSKGKTLIGGTSYDIQFKPKNVTVTLQHSRLHSAGGVEINGVSYADKADETTLVLEVPVGTSMYAWCNFNTHGSCSINYNGQYSSERNMTITLVRNTVVTFSSGYWDGDYTSDVAITD